MTCALRHKLVVVPFIDVQNAVESNRLSLEEQREFNTKFHSLEEISNALPDTRHFSSQSQPWILLEPFLPLITATQGRQLEQVHQIRLPKVLISQLARVSQSSAILGHISESDKEDFAALFPHTTTQDIDIDTLVKAGKFFIRLDACSLKDSLQGSGPARSTVDLWTRLATSARGIRGVLDFPAEWPDQPVNMWLLPWQEDMKPELEYRVFCPPSGAQGRPRIAAISQYKWHSQWMHARERVQDGFDVAGLVQGCASLLERILQCEGMTADMRERGFVFDVAESLSRSAGGGGGSLQLIELNCFGAMSGCGACLFHWIRDAEVLYGLKEEVEVRVTY